MFTQWMWWRIDRSVVFEFSQNFLFGRGASYPDGQLSFAGAVMDLNLRNAEICSRQK